MSDRQSGHVVHLAPTAREMQSRWNRWPHLRIVCSVLSVAARASRQMLHVSASTGVVSRAPPPPTPMGVVCGVVSAWDRTGVSGAGRKDS